MPRLTFAHHTIQTTAAIHAESELNQTTDNPCYSHDVVETGEPPHKHFLAVFYYPDNSTSTFDGKEWKHYV